MKNVSTENYKNIIFDLGGVILNIDFEKTTNTFMNLGVSNFEQLYSKAKQNNLFDDYESGKISSDEFIFGIQKLVGISLTEQQIINAWNALLLDLPEERLSLLNNLKKSHRLFLLSNTNDIHFKAFSAYLLKTFGSNDFSNYFEKEYYSFQTGMRKPNAEIFELVLNENGLNKGETLFVDDTLRHIEGAKKVGIHTLHLTDGNTIVDIFGRK